MRVVAVVLSVMLAGCGNTQGSTPAETPENVVVISPSDVAVARVADIASGLMITGTLEPSEMVDIKAQVPGTLRQVSVDRGSPVKRGQRLAVIDAEGIRSQVSGAQAGVAAAQSNIAAAEANLAAARQKYEGAKTLFEAGAMSAVDFQATQAQYEAAVGQVASAKSQAAAAGSQLTGAREQAGRTIVQAPISGVISQRSADDGEAVTVGQSLFQIVNSATLELAGQIPVQQASQAHVGQRVVFTLDAYPGQEFSGTVARIDPVADPATRRVGIALQLANPGGRIVGGQFVTGKVITANVARGLVVPRTALRGEGNARYVLVIEGDRIVRRDVVAGAVDDASGTVPIQSGMKEGERVIISPALDIQPGTRVQQAAGPERQDAK
jgi:membrane fusion protein (multidrug efflux system)